MRYVRIGRTLDVHSQMTYVRIGRTLDVHSQMTYVRIGRTLDVHSQMTYVRIDKTLHWKFEHIYYYFLSYAAYFLAGLSVACYRSEVFSGSSLFPPPIKLTTTTLLKYCWKWH